jgi:membrane protease YdiL (CAAX protease family)
LQSCWFGIFHYAAGFPNGFIGIALTFLFGLGTGYTAWRTGGLLVPVLIHAAADYAIFWLVLLRGYGLI